MKISIKVITHAKKSEVVGDDIDLLGARILRVKISQPPEDGKANKALIELLAEYFKIKKIQLQLLRAKNQLTKLLRLNKR